MRTITITTSGDLDGARLLMEHAVRLTEGLASLTPDGSTVTLTSPNAKAEVTISDAN